MNETFEIFLSTFTQVYLLLTMTENVSKSSNLAGKFLREGQWGAFIHDHFIHHYARIGVCVSVYVHSPLHHNKQTLPALIEVLKDIDDAHNVGTRWCSPVELHFPTGLGTILQHLKRTGTRVGVGDLEGSEANLYHIYIQTTIQM